ncbi:MULTISPECIES: phage tail assembly chaperone [Achromobacter]|uniref:Phage protein n=1 Tax=Achromobacter piechaudii TaxID=72556 RepID=A0ABN7F161_9BURK|nr:phage tail assembly chaperone [Achromobacter piechaudii]MPS76583.1 hypothetical protein [Achromobacter sp.]CAB3704605.1 hypothetical protein LMG1873_02860 [Achromobacter piechaudii]
MAFIIKANPTIDATVTIVGQGRKQKLAVTFRHKTSDEYEALMNRLKSDEISTAELLVELIAQWDADMPLEEASISVLRQHQPGADLAIMQAYNQALQVEREKN